MNMEMPKGKDNKGVENKETQEQMKVELNRLRKNEERSKILSNIDQYDKDAMVSVKKISESKINRLTATLAGYASAIGGSVWIMDQLNEIQAAGSYEKQTVAGAIAVGSALVIIISELAKSMSNDNIIINETRKSYMVHLIDEEQKKLGDFDNQNKENK